MSAASNVVKLPNIEEQVQRKTADDLPCPYSKQQVQEMSAELKAALELHEKSGASLLEFQADAIFIVGKWSARAGRLYAWERVQELRGEFANVSEKLAETIRAQGTELTMLRDRCEVLERLIAPRQ